MNSVNQKIIDAVIAKAEQVCPDSLALIGVYGSVATGDDYAKSDLDLLILIQNDYGWQLGTGFILNDSGIGYDIYCTNWDGLKFDSQCHHAQLAKLLDSKIVYVKNQEAFDELCKLREQTKLLLESDKRFDGVNELVDKAKMSYANANLHETLGEVRIDVFGVMYYLMDAVMLFHKRYFRRGTKRMLDELLDLPIEKCFVEDINSVVLSTDVLELRSLAKKLILYVESLIRQENVKKTPSQDLRGTYEEIYSNWRNKVEEAAESGNAFASFMNMCNLHYMFMGISSEYEIGDFDIMTQFNPHCLKDNVEIFDSCLQKYGEVYKSAGIDVKSFADVDEFVTDYLGE